MNISCPAWAANTLYNVGDYVISTSVIYQCIAGHTSGGSFSATNWTTTTVALQCVNAAIQFVNKACNRDFRTGAYTVEFTGNDSLFVYADNSPVTALSSIKALNTSTGEWETIFTGTDTISDSAKVINEHKIQLLKGYSFAVGTLYQLVYTGGYADGAAPVNEICLEVAQDFWNNSNASGQSRQGLSSENIGGQSSNGKGFNPDAVSERFKSQLEAYRVIKI